VFYWLVLKSAQDGFALWWGDKVMTDEYSCRGSVSTFITITRKNNAIATVTPMRQAIPALLDESARRAFGFPDPPAWLVALAVGGLRPRGWLLAWLPVHRRPRLRTQLPHRSYLQGWVTENLGPRWIADRRISSAEKHSRS
jgi:hypothetical protein